MNRKDPQLANQYKKDSKDEAFLSRLNSILAPHETDDYEDVGESYPTLNVIGAPRSGTTLLSQLVSAHMDIGYINNLIAAFWRAPVYGIRLSNKLIKRGTRPTYESEFGRTSQIHEPHEFGYFWHDLLNYDEFIDKGPEHDQAIDWDRFQRVLNNMTHAFGAPIVFKPFLLGMHLAKVQKLMPKACFVRIKRDPLQNALSLLKLRENLLGSTEKWASFKPIEYEWLQNESSNIQVAGQVYYLERMLEKQIESVKSRNVLEVDYQEMCADPESTLRKISKMLQENGSDCSVLSVPEKKFQVTEYAVDDSIKNEILAAFHRFDAGRE